MPTFVDINCSYCGVVFQRQLKIYNSDLKRNPNISFYCSKDCYGKGKPNGTHFNCGICGKSVYRIKSKSVFKNYYCSKKCQVKGMGLARRGSNHPMYNGGNGTYRKFALEEYGAVCSKCGYDQNAKMLDVDHIDSDRSNNSLENLQVLCVWCHALKTRKVDYHERV